MVHVSDQRLEVTVHLGEHGEAILALRASGFHLGVLVDLRNRGVQGGLALTNSLDVLLVLADLGLLVLVALSSHLAKVGLARLLDLRPAHLGLGAAYEGLLAGVVTSKASLLNFGLNLAGRQQLPLLEDLVGALLQFLAQRADGLNELARVGVHILLILVCHVKLHPVDVERAGLGAIH